MRVKKNVDFCINLYIFIIVIEGLVKGYLLRTYFLQFFNKIIIKKMNFLN